MEALVLSCSTGGGHNAAAKAIVEQLKEHHHHVVFFDPYSLKSKHLAHQVGETYIKTVQMAPRLFGLIYKIGKAYSNMQHAEVKRISVLCFHSVTHHRPDRQLENLTSGLSHVLTSRQ